MSVVVSDHPALFVSSLQCTVGVKLDGLCVAESLLIDRIEGEGSFGSVSEDCCVTLHLVACRSARSYPDPICGGVMNVLAEL